MKDETGWLLEKHTTDGYGIAYIGVIGGFLEWTHDPNKALRLARREDADALCEIVDDCDKVADHCWPMKDETTQERCPHCGGSKYDPQQVGGALYGKQIAPLFCVDNFHHTPASAQRSAPSGQRVSVASESGGAREYTERRQRIASLVAQANCNPALVAASEFYRTCPEFWIYPLANSGLTGDGNEALLRVHAAMHAYAESRVSALREKLALTESQLKAKDIIAANLVGKLEYAIERFTEIAKMGMPGQMRERAKAALSDLSPFGEARG